MSRKRRHTTAFRARTAQAVHRPGGNHKGVFTRDRQPKAAAWLLRDLWRQRSGPAAVD